MTIDMKAIQEQMAYDYERTLAKTKTKPPIEVLDTYREGGVTMATCRCLHCTQIFTTQLFKITNPRITSCGCLVKARSSAASPERRRDTNKASNGQRRPYQPGDEVNYFTIGSYEQTTGAYTVTCICGHRTALTRAQMRSRRHATCGGSRCEELYINYLKIGDARKALSDFASWKQTYLSRLLRMTNGGVSLIEAQRRLGYSPKGPQRKRLKTGEDEQFSTRPPTKKVRVR